jgi:hypothetical protein
LKVGLVHFSRVFPRGIQNDEEDLGIVVLVVVVVGFWWLLTEFFGLTESECGLVGGMLNNLLVVLSRKHQQDFGSFLEHGDYFGINLTSKASRDGNGHTGIVQTELDQGQAAISSFGFVRMLED